MVEKNLHESQRVDARLLTMIDAAREGRYMFARLTYGVIVYSSVSLVDAAGVRLQ